MRILSIYSFFKPRSRGKTRFLHVLRKRECCLPVCVKFPATVLVTRVLLYCYSFLGGFQGIARLLLGCSEWS